MSMSSAVFSFTQSAPCAPGQFMKSLHTHTGLTAIFPMDGAPLCAHHTPFPSTFCQFSCTQALPHMFRIWSHHRIWMQSPTLSPTSWSDSASTPAQRPFFWEAGTLIGGPPPLSSYPWQRFARTHARTSISSQIALHLDPPVRPCHSSTRGSLAHHWPQSTSFRLVGAPIKCPPPPPISLQHSVHACAHMFRIQPHFRIWTCPSVLASHLGGLFHHKPALVASFILWLEYLLCAHHPPSPSFNLPHCTRTHTPSPAPPALPHSTAPVPPCVPLPAASLPPTHP